MITPVLTRPEAQALVRGKHTKRCAWNTPEGGQGVACTCNWVAARNQVKAALRYETEGSAT